MNKKNIKTHFNYLFIFLSFIILLTSGCSNETISSKAELPKFHNIGLTKDEFKDKFYTATKNLDMNIKISSYRIDEKDGYSSISAEISPDTGFIATVNPDNTIRSLALLSAPNDTSNSAVEVLSSMAILIDIVTPGLMPQDRGKILKDLNFDENISDKSHTQTIRGNIKYTLNFVKGIGIEFVATSKNDE